MIIKLIIVCMTLFVTGCATTLPNGCLVEAISHKKAIAAKEKLEGATSFNKILLVRGGSYGSGERNSLAHCYNVFLWPPGQNKLWAYDIRGSQRVRAYVWDANQIAKKLWPPAATGEFLE